MVYDIIHIDHTKDKLLSAQALQLLQDYYMLPAEVSPQEAFARAAMAYCDEDYNFAQRIYDYANHQWIMYSSAVLSNDPEKGAKLTALPISCFVS